MRVGGWGLVRPIKILFERRAYCNNEIYPDRGRELFGKRNA